MKISDDKLKLFKSEGTLREYLKVNGNSGAAVEEPSIDGIVLVLALLR